MPIHKIYIYTTKSGILHANRQKMYKDTCNDSSHKTRPIFRAWNVCDNEKKHAVSTSSMGPITQGKGREGDNFQVKDEIKTKYSNATVLNYLIITIMTLVSTGIVLNRGSVCVAK